MTRPIKSIVEVPSEQRRPLTSDESRFFVALNLGLPDETLVPTSELEAAMVTEFGEQATQHFFTQVMLKRLINTPADRLYSPRMVMLAVSFTDRVGNAVQWAYAISEQSRLGTPMTVDRFSRDLFPWGVPTDQGYHDIWDAQKYDGPRQRMGSDNWLDYPAAWTDGTTTEIEAPADAD
jgi:hypothetical protein